MADKSAGTDALSVTGKLPGHPATHPASPQSNPETTTKTRICAASTNAIFHPKRITHAVLNVGDVEASLDFYTGILGLQVHRGSPADGYVVLGGTTGGEHIILIPTPDSEATGLHHAGFAMWSNADFDEGMRSLQEIGLSSEEEITTTARRSLFIRDPDDFLLEFYTELQPNTPCPVTTPN